MILSVTPSCCDKMRRSCAITIEVDSSTLCDATPAGRPYWCIRLRPLHERVAHPSTARWAAGEYDAAPAYCPYCGSKLPEIVPRPGVTAPVFKPTDEYCDYCETCGERSMGCTCLPPQAAWMPASAEVLANGLASDDLDVNALWAEERARVKAYPYGD